MSAHAAGDRAAWAGKRILIAYHSRTGHTATVARILQEQTGGDLFEIVPAEPYPEDYDALVAQNVKEQQANHLPPLRTDVAAIRSYDLIFIGSPIWNVRLTPPVRSFLSRHDLSGKAVAPFVTYIVSRLGRTREDVAEAAPQARIIDGLAVLGEDAERAESIVNQWLSDVQNQ
jgi:flavodoxin